MARRNARGNELSFHPVRKRWYKSGKQFPSGRMEFGHGKGVGDRESYRAALARYKAWQEQQDAARKQTESVAHLQALLDATSDPHAGFTISHEDIRRRLEQGGLEGTEVGDAFTEVADDRERAELVQTLNELPLEQLRAVKVVLPGEASTTASTVGAMIDAFVADQRRRNQMRKHLDARREKGEQITEAPKEFIGDDRLASILRDAKTFKAFAGQEVWDDREATAAALLKKWRAASEELMVAGRLSANTFNDRIKIARQFVQWAFDGYKLDALPRDLKKLCRKYEYTPTAKAIPLDDLKKLWASADDLTRTFMALGLNLGYYAKDISNLTAGMLQGGYVNHTRGKTGVQVRYKLWPVTLALVARNRTDGGGGRLFTGRNGRPLIHHTDSDSKGRTDVCRLRFQRLCRKLGLTEAYTGRDGKPRRKARYSFSNLRDTATTAVENIDRRMSDLFDSHRDARMARFYIDGKHVDTKPLDDVIDRLDTFFGLPLPAESPKKRRKRAATVPGEGAPKPA